MSPAPGLDSGIESGDDDFKKADRLAARAARFSNKLPGNRFKELEESRSKERKAFEDQGLIKVGKTELDDAIDMRGSCEKMCSDYEREFREYTREIHPFEAAPNKRMNPAKAVAAYSRSDAGAGHGESAILPSDLRTPQTLVRTLDYLFSQIMPTQSPELVGPPTARKALGYTAGFIRDRTRAIRKEFAMQSSWGHDEAISSFERIARWHILCLRELQEETGMNSDMHIDSAELGRCFTSLRQHYNDRREELGVELPCANEPEFQAYMLIFNLADKSVAIPTSELPSVILDNPLVQLAWDIRRTAQRNFDIQKEGSKSNAEYGANMINLFVRLLRQPKVPYLLACLVEVRLREMRRSAIRALTRTYPRLRADPLRYNDQGEVVERRMLLIQTLGRILGCEEQDDEGSAYDDVDPVPKDPDHEAIDTVQKFQLEVYPNAAAAMGALINLGVAYNDNRDAPYTRRWKMITAKRASLSFVDVVNGTAGVRVDGTAAPIVQSTPRRAIPPQQVAPSLFPTLNKPSPAAPGTAKPKIPAFSFGPPSVPLNEQASTSTIPNRTDLPFTFGPRPSEPAPRLVKPSQPEPAKPPAFTFSAPPPIPSPTIVPPATSAAVQPAPSFPPVPAFGPTPANPVVASPTTSNLAIPTTPPATPSAKALGKRPAVSRPAPSPRISEHDRRRNRRAAPALKNEMIQDILRDTLSDMTVDLLKMVKQEDAARRYHQASEQRHKAIGTWSTCVYDAIRAEMIERIARKAVLKELKRRYLSRKYSKLWRTWARRRKTEQRNLTRDRRQVFADFGKMGLGGGDMTLSEGFAEGSTVRAVSEIRDEFLADVSLRESASERAHLFASTTFLHIIARHVTPLLAAGPFDPLASLSSPLSSISRKSNALYEWETVLSLAQDAGSAPPPEASDWLKAKLLPKDESFYESSDTLFDTFVIGRYDDLPAARAVGLIIFEAPLKGDDGEVNPQDIVDAQDRLSALSTMSQDQTNRYDPALLVLTWQQETMEEIAARLDIRSHLDQYPSRALICLSALDTVDSSLETILKSLIPVVVPKRQVVIKLRELLGCLLPIWQRYIDTTRLLLRDRPTDGNLALFSFKSGVEIINEVSIIAHRSLGPVKISEFDPFIPVTLPVFDTTAVKSLQDTAESIADYLSHDDLSGVDEVDLLLGPLTRAASANTVLPIVEILSSLSSLVFGELSNQIMPLDSYWAPAIADEVVHGYMVTAAGSYESFIHARLEDLGRMSLSLDAQSRAPSTGFASPTALKTGSKRGRMSSSENLRVSPSAKQVKATKNARLVDVMADVKRTLGEMNVDAVY